MDIKIMSWKRTVDLLKLNHTRLYFKLSTENPVSKGRYNKTKILKLRFGGLFLFFHFPFFFHRMKVKL